MTDYFKNLEQKLDNVLAFLKSNSRTHIKVMFNAEEAAVYLGISKSTLYKHTSAGNIAFHKPNGKLMSFSKADLDKWLWARRVPSNDELDKTQ